MRIVDLPNEVILLIFEYAGPQALVEGLAETCQLFREISNDSRLWEKTLASRFAAQFLSVDEIAAIGDKCQWLREQSAISASVAHELDGFVGGDLRRARRLGALAKFPESVMDVDDDTGSEGHAWGVVKYRLRAREALLEAVDHPKSLGHYVAAKWFLKTIMILEGIQRINSLECEQPVSDLRNALIACKLVMGGYFPEEINRSFSIDTANRREAAEILVTEICSDHSTLSEASKMTVLVRSSLFITTWTRMGWPCRLITTSMSSYVYVEDDVPFFVDFMRNGMLRSLPEMRYFLHCTDSLAGVHYGVDLTEIMDANMLNTPLTGLSDMMGMLRTGNSIITPSELFGCLLDRASNGGERTDESRRTDEYSCIVNTDTHNVGKVFRVEGEFCIVLDWYEPCLVCLRNSIMSTSVSALEPVATPLPLVYENGFPVPDIGIDLVRISQYFTHFNEELQRFE